MFAKKFIDRDFFLKSGETYDPLGFIDKLSKIKNPFSKAHVIPPHSIMGEAYVHFDKLYKKGDHLGSGAFGEVYVVANKNGKKFACKEQKKERIELQGLNKLVVHEALIMKHLTGHPHVVSLDAAIEDRENVYFVMDLCQRGDILQTIMRHFKEHGTYTEIDAAAIARKMFDAIDFCHDNGVMHRDIKPENFLWTEDEVMKVTDFGLSSFFKKGEYMTNTCGTPPYVAPEMWRGEPYNEAVDVWALGVTLVIMLIGKFPFNGEDVERLRDNIVLQELNYDFYPYNMLSDDCRDLLSKLLEKDKTKRITLKDAMKHPWLVENGTAANINLKTRVETNIVDFVNQGDFIQACMRQMANKNSAEIEAIRKNFQRIDVDGDGCLTFAEIQQGLADLSIEMTVALFDKIDKDNRGFISIDQFIVASLSMRAQFVENRALETFKMLDVDGDNSITKEEMRQVIDVLDLNDEALDSLYSEMDKNGDGKVELEEFMDYWKKNVQNDHQMKPLMPTQ